MTLSFEEILKITNPQIIPFVLPIYNVTDFHIGKKLNTSPEKSLTGTLSLCNFYNKENHIHEVEIAVPNIIDSLNIEFFIKEKEKDEIRVKLFRAKRTKTYYDNGAVGYGIKNIFLEEQTSKKTSFLFSNVKIPFIKNDNTLRIEFVFKKIPVFFETKISCEFIILSKQDILKLTPLLPKIKIRKHKKVPYSIENIRSVSLSSGAMFPIETVEKNIENNDNENDLKYLSLIEEKTYIPTEVEIASLFLTTNSISRLNILFEIMKRFPVKPKPKYGDCYDFENGIPGVLVKRELCNFFINYDIIENTDGTITYISEIDFNIEADAIFDLQFSLSLQSEKVIEFISKIDSNSPFFTKKYLQATGNFFYESKKQKEMIICLINNKFSVKINFTVKERLKSPIFLVTKFTEVVLKEEMQGNLWSMQRKLKIIKKADGLLEVNKVSGGEVRETFLLRN